MEPVAVHTYTIADSIEDYLAEARARGLRSSTIVGAYGWPLRSLWLPWCQEHGVEAGALTQAVVNRFTGDLRERRRRDGQLLSPHSVRNYSIVVTRWLAWAHAQGHLVAAVRVPRTRVGRPVREVVTEDEFSSMVAVARNDRDRLMVQMLWETGMRASELLHLRLGDLVRHDGRWFLRVLAPYRGGGAKGDRERLVPFPQARDLQRYLNGQRARIDTPSDRVFLSRRRNALGAYEPLTISGLQQVVNHLARDARIERRVHPHLFRHSAVTRWLRQGMDALRVAAILGHTSLEMIQGHYSQLDHRDAYDALAAVLVRERR